MKENLSKDMNLVPEDVNIKATTTEGMGFIGRKEGIAVYSVVVIEN